MSSFKPNYSFIIPVYNRPNEIKDLLDSFTGLKTKFPYEIIIVEDGSDESLKAEKIVSSFKDKLTITYLEKPNTGAGLSRNYGMQHALGDYFIILDSDVLLPSNYLSVVHQALQNNFTDAFGGPDAAHDSFTSIQKAINYAMTSFLTTGGLRGGKNNRNFQPRSFNMGLSRKAFEQTGGFSNRKIGEDIELSLRFKYKELSTQLIHKAFVYHKRRVNFKQFYKQTYSFGKERPLLNKEFAGTFKITYWFPSLFIIGLFTSFILVPFQCYLPIFIFLLYFISIIIHSGWQNRSVKVGLLSVWATLVQFFGYGLGYLTSQKGAKYY
jgi:glycosyltransferase involved in cell wall biosynthesis